MEFIKVSRRTVFGLAFIIVTALFILLYKVYALSAENLALRNKEVANEQKMLNIVRTGEVSKSMVTLELLRCKGVKQQVLDSMMIKIFLTNTQLMKRDSSFIVERYKEVNK